MVWSPSTLVVGPGVDQLPGNLVVTGGRSISERFLQSLGWMVILIGTTFEDMDPRLCRILIHSCSLLDIIAIEKAGHFRYAGHSSSQAALREQQLQGDYAKFNEFVPWCHHARLGKCPF